MNGDVDGRLSPPATKKGQLQRACLAILREHERDGALPTSPRFVYYELVQAGAVSKQRTGARRPDQVISEALTHLREQALVPWEWIADETRTLHSWEYGATVAEYLTGAVQYARIDCWSGEPAPQILCESRTFGGVLSRRRAPRPLRRRPRPRRRAHRGEHRPDAEGGTSLWTPKDPAKAARSPVNALPPNGSRGVDPAAVVSRNAY
jgi:hypothetical protein